MSSFPWHSDCARRDCDVNGLIERLNLGERLRKENISRYILQCSLAGLVVLIVLLVLDAVTQTVLIAALGASAFIAFAVPWSILSGPRNMIGGYVVGMVCGCIMGISTHLFHLSDPIVAHAVMVLFGAIATGLAMFVMVVTRTEHPPAAALALGLVLNEWDLLTLGVVFSGIVALSVIKRLVLPILMDLV
jgi:CBS domain-containing membrane protein